MVKNDNTIDSNPDQVQMANTSVNYPASSIATTSNSARVTATVADCNSSSNSSINGSSHPPLQSTVFIHKLYNILEDDDLKDLIWWSPNGLSFLIRPTERFSRGLATYFKHTNIASFVRQLNMYGFHKVSNDHGKNLDHDANSNNNSRNGSTDGQEDIKIWKFRHSTGLFKRGDIEGLKYIKRRSSRNISNSNARKNPNNSGMSTNNCNGINNVTGISTKGMLSNIQVHDEQEKDQFQRPLSQQQPQEPQMQHYQQSQQVHQQQSQQVQRGTLPEMDSTLFASPHPSQMQQQPLPYASYPAHSASVTVPSTGSDPLLESRYTELSQNHNILRYEYNSLQYRYDEMFDELRGINVDMIHLLELIESLVTIQSTSDQQQHDLSGIEQELIRFKTLLLNRLHRNSEVQIQQQLQKATRETHPIASPSVTTSHSAVPNFVQHVFSVPARTPSNMNVISQASTAGRVPSGASTAPPGPPPPQSVPSMDQFPRVTMMNPFETTGNGSKRNMSILMDPLAPAPNLMVAASPSHPSPYMNPSPAAAASLTNYRTPRQADKYSRVSVIASKNSHSSITSDCSSASSCLSHQHVVRTGTPTGHHIDAGAGVPPIKQEEQQDVISMTEPRRPPSTREQTDIVRPIPTRSVGPSESIRGSSAVYSLLNDEQPHSSSLDNERTADKKVNL